MKGVVATWFCPGTFVDTLVHVRIEIEILMLVYEIVVQVCKVCGCNGVHAHGVILLSFDLTLVLFKTFYFSYQRMNYNLLPSIKIFGFNVLVDNY